MSAWQSHTHTRTHTHTHTHTQKHAGVIILMSMENLAALSHDLFSVVLPSIKHTLSHRTGRADPEVVTAVWHQNQGSPILNKHVPAPQRVLSLCSWIEMNTNNKLQPLWGENLNMMEQLSSRNGKSALLWWITLLWSVLRKGQSQLNRNWIIQTSCLVCESIWFSRFCSNYN